jgi:hypothetical protein
VIVLSDLHLGPDNLLSTFRDEETLAALFDRFSQEADAPRTELILAGDLFDFLQTEGYGGFDAARSVERLETILSGRRTAAVIEALRRWAGRPGLEITVLAGNHDPEMLLPAVRSDESPALWGRAVGAGERQANVLQARGDLEGGRSNWPQAFDWYRQAVPLYESVGDSLGLSNVLAEPAEEE